MYICRTFLTPSFMCKSTLIRFRFSLLQLFRSELVYFNYTERRFDANTLWNSAHDMTGKKLKILMPYRSFVTLFYNSSSLNLGMILFFLVCSRIRKWHEIVMQNKTHKLNQCVPNLFSSQHINNCVDLYTKQKYWLVLYIMNYSI